MKASEYKYLPARERARQLREHILKLEQELFVLAVQEEELASVAYTGRPETQSMEFKSAVSNTEYGLVAVRAKIAACARLLESAENEAEGEEDEPPGL